MDSFGWISSVFSIVGVNTVKAKISLVKKDPPIRKKEESRLMRMMGRTIQRGGFIERRNMKDLNKEYM